MITKHRGKLFILYRLKLISYKLSDFLNNFSFGGIRGKYRRSKLKRNLKIYNYKSVSVANLYKYVIYKSGVIKFGLKKFYRVYLFNYIKRVLLIFIIVSFISLFPACFSFPPENLPYYGNFQWKSLTVSKLSAGDFIENGRGGLELLPPKLRLIEYRVKRGDTLWGIARRFNIDPDSIISSNSFTNVHRLSIGETIYIPNIKGIFISINKKSTIYKISKKYNISTDLIMDVNDLESPVLEPGMKIFLPGVRYNIMKRAFALGEAFDKPVRGRLTSRFGYRRDPFTGKIAFHTGIDIANRIGAAVHSARDGVVTFVGLKRGYGLVIQIKHRFGYKTVYGHLLGAKVKVGQKVKRGQIIGFVGNSGRSTGPHLHFEVWLKSRLIDPMTQTNMAIR